MHARRHCTTRSHALTIHHTVQLHAANFPKATGFDSTCPTSAVPCNGLSLGEPFTQFISIFRINAKPLLGSGSCIVFCGFGGFKNKEGIHDKTQQAARRVRDGKTSIAVNTFLSCIFLPSVLACPTKTYSFLVLFIWPGFAVVVKAVLVL